MEGPLTEPYRVKAITKLLRVWISLHYLLHYVHASHVATANGSKHFSL